jgi:hypothetical protein
MGRLHYAANRRKRTWHARPAECGWVAPRPPQPEWARTSDRYFIELVSVVGWEDRGRVIVTVLDREEATELRDTLAIMLRAKSDMSD